MTVHKSITIHREVEVGLASVILGFIHYLKQQGLSLPQVNALLFIYHMDRCQVSDISLFTDSSTAAASQLVERLVHQGLVERLEDPSDRRTRILKLTPKGQALFQDGLASNQPLGSLIRSLTKEQQKTVQAAFTILAQAARQIQASNPQKEGKHA
jgi:DNA-binding MarR family transcriptional regulator